ncbi:MAG: UbiA family prenyltransferase [Planctomycetes bacterium]|nr:UbiA family prenyltransferase [Planctomycetota bacterium]
MNDSTSTAWWQLLRAGNVFTAISNILAGFLLVRGEWQPVLPLIFLILSSAALYLAGMVLNDVFDLEADRVQRPERPLPSGRIDPSLAKLVGWGLMIDGLSAAAVAAWLLASCLPIIVALLLAAAIISYDALLKKTMLGPLAMGVCRSLNVLLGASVVLQSTDKNAAYLYALLLGIYTIGLTLLARKEAESARIQKYVSLMITLFIPFDALACAAGAGWPAGLTVFLLLIPTYIATRRAPMT